MSSRKTINSEVGVLAKTHIISLKTREGKWGRFKVPPEVYLYIHRLEHCIERSGVLEIKESLY